MGAPKRDTIWRCISDPGVPPQQGDTVAVAVVLARWARWDVDDMASRIAGLWLQARLTAPPGKPLAEVTDPFALEVHHAISTDLLSASPGLPVLPLYVERDHDARLRAIAEEANGGKSRLVILTGGSSTGKTRACWEVLRHLPDKWRLWHPFDPTRPEAALATIEQLAPRTVVWLNEAQHYLLTASDLGERLAAKLRTLLADPGRAPVLVLGTLWPEFWRTLTSLPEPGAREDPHAQARALLAGHSLPVPPAFSDTDLRALATRAESDPRLAYAADHAEGGAITQYLAGAPALLERYRAAGDGAQALLKAAMDARRLGHRPALPLALLEGAAAGYLSDTQWDLLDEDWLEQALAYNAKPLRGARGLLTRIRPRLGQAAPSQPHYRLADYLEQHGRRHRHTSRTPVELWNALIDHATASDRLTLAGAAQERGLLRIAVNLYATAGDADKATALRFAGRRLADAGRLDDAVSWFERAAEAGDDLALRMAAEQLARAGRLDEALPWFERAGKTGDALAMLFAAEQLVRVERWEEAFTWYERAAVAGDAPALRLAAVRLAGAGRVDEALPWFERAAKAGDDLALRMAAEQLARAGRLDEALPFSQRAGDAGDTEALRFAAQRLADAGRLDEALPWYERAAQAGAAEALRVAAQRLAGTGRLDEALPWYERAAEAGGTEAQWYAAEQLAQSGRWEEAFTWFERAARAGDVLALRFAAEQLAWAGRWDEAFTWFERAGDAGDTEALRFAAQRLADAGRLDEALPWYERAAQAGKSKALRFAADRLMGAGQREEALTWYERAAEGGDAEALRVAADRLAGAHGLAGAGRLDEALPWYERAADAGDIEALRIAAEQLARAGRLDEALPWYERAAEAGDTDEALRSAAVRLGDAGRLDEALLWYERAAEAGDTEALRIAGYQLTKAGRLDEAESLRRYGREPDRMIAHAWTP